METRPAKLRERLSLRKCRETLGQSKDKYSDSELLAIRDFLYQLAQVDYDVFVFNQRREEEFLKKDNDLKSAA